MVLESISNFFQDLSNFKNLMNVIPEDYKILINLFLYTVFVVIYAVFIWRFYRFLASKEILELNLRKYNYSKYPFLEKFFAVVLYTIEYLVILPFLVFFWFTIFSLFLLLLSEQSAGQILLVSAAIIASTRLTAYISEDLSKDLAKILPFTVLAIFILNPDFFDFFNLFEKIREIPLLFNQILIFLVFIFVVEFTLRIFYSIGQLFHSSDGDVE